MQLSLCIDKTYGGGFRKLLEGKNTYCTRLVDVADLSNTYSTLFAVPVAVAVTVLVLDIQKSLLCYKSDSGQNWGKLYQADKAFLWSQSSTKTTLLKDKSDMSLAVSLN